MVNLDEEQKGVVKALLFSGRSDCVVHTVSATGVVRVSTLSEDFPDDVDC